MFLFHDLGFFPIPSARLYTEISNSLNMFRLESLRGIGIGGMISHNIWAFNTILIHDSSLDDLGPVRISEILENLIKGRCISNFKGQRKWPILIEPEFFPEGKNMDSFSGWVI